ncbi:glutamine-rich protein 2-like [Pempheris klunzingeri]|uniref:glutamine-rich protein 2-like n=1 Tax=Pempheris klunzingeri TaxID=3127111 RepID=UPI0039809899
MSEGNISLYDLLNLSIGAPQQGAVNFSALHALLHAVLGQLGVREMKTRWTDTPPGEGRPPAPVGVTTAAQDHRTWEQLTQRDISPDTKLQDPTASSSSPTPSSSSSSSSGPAGDGQRRLRTCEDGVSQAMKLIQELQDQKDSLREEIKELRHQQKMVGVHVERVTAVEECCHRVDVLEETVRSLRDTFQRYPAPEELSQCVTWDVMQSALLTKRESLQHAPSGPVDAATTSTLSSPHPAGDADRPAAPTLQEVMTDSRPAIEDPSRLSGPQQQTHPKSGHTAAGMSMSPKASAAERYPETVEALRDVGKLKDKFNKLEAHVAALGEGQVDQSQLTHLRELIANKGSQDASNSLRDQLDQQRASLDSLKSDREKNVELVNNVQEAILQLQADCEKLHQTTRCLHEDNRQKQSHIEELYKTTEELEEKKADKQMVESEIKADKSALESKVSRLQFDSATEQLNAMFHELLNKVTGHEQDWHKVIDKLSTEMKCKLNRIELDSVKKQLEDRWKNIHEKLQSQGAPEHEDAAGLRKQLVDRFHCLSCDRPVVKYTSGPQHAVKLASTSGFPSHKSIRPFTVYALEQFRHHYRSERVPEVTDYGHMSVSRSCGGSHTVTSASQRRAGLQPMKHHPQTEADGTGQSEEVDIIGLDGHIYKGRLNAPAIRNTETKLPTISTKDAGMCKAKDKPKCSLAHKPAASPELGHSAALHHPHSAKSAHSSRSACSSSGRDWPVSTLGCTSQSSITQSNTEPQDDEPPPHL